ncbi:ABC-ATPase domain-containing protein [Staphylospora marina]|uniref:ABC-ATPase domain-containing protein n=1 Tax=Staphylospora marina TaxID=2490858 RepID=UPI000F5C2263|nr:ABC-ATPase domain-containing protein [Staphylospora marina]
MKKLEDILRRIDGKGYKAYKDIEGVWRFPSFTLYIDHVQGDPFASPTRIRVRMPMGLAAYPGEWRETPRRKIALEDWLTRKWARLLDAEARRVGTGKSGMISIDRPGQEIIQRSSVNVCSDSVEARLEIGLPARGRTVLGREAARMLLEVLPACAERAFFLSEKDKESVRRRMELTDNQEAIREEMRRRGWVAFIADGAVLPRESGASDRPMKGGDVIRFASPESMRVSVSVPHGTPVSGMAVPKGITLIVGGGYHGKSTLLKAIERGVYDHVEGDGREYVLTDRDAVKIRAEDGRSVKNVNISPFINNLPFKRDTRSFSTDDASGSTSQAAAIMEALEAGASCLLIDEDTSATNFMIRDARMQALVAKEKEPITPFVDKVRQLYDEHGVSCILVLGGSGDYFGVADKVILMDHYRPVDVTTRAHEIAREFGDRRHAEGGDRFGEVTDRRVRPDGFDARRGSREKVDAKGLHTILYGTEPIDLSGLEQLVHPSQTRALAWMIKRIAERADGKVTLREWIDRLTAETAEQGLETISPFRGHPGNLAMPRKHELAGAINRLRTLSVQRGDSR